MTVIAGASDAVDGYIARAFGHKSRCGAYLDPMADKFLILTLFGILTYLGPFAALAHGVGDGARRRDRRDGRRVHADEESGSAHATAVR